MIIGAFVVRIGGISVSTLVLTRATYYLALRGDADRWPINPQYLRR